MLQKVFLRNFCQFEDAEFEFTPGINCIRGRNGAGKSNLLRAIRFGFTGSVPGRDKQDLIRRGVSPDEESFVKVVFSTPQGDAYLERSISPNRTVLEEANRARTSGSKAVAKRLAEVLCLETADAFDLAFIDQRQLDAFIDMAETARRTYIGEVLGVSRIKAIWDELGSFLSKFRSEQAILAEESELKEKIADLTSRVEKDSQALSVAVIKRDTVYGKDFLSQSMQKLAALHERLRDLDRLEDLRREKAQLELSLEQARSLVCGLKMVTEELIPYIDQLKGDLERSEPVQDLRQRWKEAVRWKSYRDALEEYRRKTVLPLLKKFHARPSAAGLKKEIASMESVIADAEGYLIQLRASLFADARLEDLRKNLKVGDRCPVCWQVVRSLPQALAVSDETGKQQLAELEEILQQGRSRLADLKRRQEARLQLRREIAAARSLRPSPPSGPPVTDDPDALTQEISRLERISSELSAALDQLRRKQQDLGEAQAKVDSLEKRISDLQVQIQCLAADAGQLDRQAIASQIEASQNFVKEASHLQEEIARLEQSIQSASQMIDLHRAQLTRLQKERRVRKKLEMLREIFHPTGAVTLFVDQSMRLMEGRINEVLEAFEARFRVSYAPPFFMASFSDGRVVPDYYLSVGERLMLAFGWHLALRAFMLGVPPLFCLDEPAAGLDEGHIHVLPEILLKVAEFARQRDIQVLFVTHDNLDDSLFSNVIRVD